MKIFKMILSLTAMLCLAITVISNSIAAAIILLIVASLRIGILIGEGSKKNGK